MTSRVMLLACFLIISGCDLQSPDYYKIMLDCQNKNGYYFSVTIPTWIGPRLVPGCIEIPKSTGTENEY